MRHAPAFLVALALAGCSSQPSTAGIGEPIFVYGAQFISGDLPGSPPLDGGTPAAPDVTTINTTALVFPAGRAGVSMNGDVTQDANAVAVRIPDQGTGYWVWNPGAPDSTAPNMLTWAMTFDVAASATPGLTTLRFAGVDASGKAGNQTDLQICIDTPYPDGFNACDPTLTPPAAVLSLAWDAPVDLDLELQTPSGVLVNPKHPSTNAGDAGVGPGPGDGVLDRDSDANCVPDHVNREDIVWKTTPTPGQYLMYADLFSACGQPAVRFTVTLYVAEPTDGGSALVQKLQQSGELLAAQANGGSGLGLYLGAFSFPFM